MDTRRSRRIILSPAAKRSNSEETSGANGDSRFSDEHFRTESRPYPISIFHAWRPGSSQTSARQRDLYRRFGDNQSRKKFSVILMRHSQALYE